MRSYTRLSVQEREELSLGLLAGLSLRRWRAPWGGRLRRFRVKWRAIASWGSIERCALSGMLEAAGHAAGAGAWIITIGCVAGYLQGCAGVGRLSRLLGS